MKTTLQLLCAILFTLYCPLGYSQTTWDLIGNSNTTPGTNYVGTSNAKALVFKTKATEWMRIDTLGNVGVGTASPSVYSGYATLALAGKYRS